MDLNFKMLKSEWFQKASIYYLQFFRGLLTIIVSNSNRVQPGEIWRSNFRIFDNQIFPILAICNGDLLTEIY